MHLPYSVMMASFQTGLGVRFTHPTNASLSPVCATKRTGLSRQLDVSNEPHNKMTTNVINSANNGAYAGDATGSSGLLQGMTNATVAVVPLRSVSMSSTGLAASHACSSRKMTPSRSGGFCKKASGSRNKSRISWSVPGPGKEVEEEKTNKLEKRKRLE